MYAKDIVSICKNPSNQPIVKPNNKHNKKTIIDIIYEDDNIIVINKPSGLLSIASDNENIIIITNRVYVAINVSSSPALPFNVNSFINFPFTIVQINYPGGSPTIKTYGSDKIDLTTGEIISRTNLLSNVVVNSVSVDNFVAI